MESEVDFKYRAEYAKSNRASCKGCKSGISKENLRLAVLVQSSHFDGKVPHWYHPGCFFNKQKPTDVGDVENFDNLRWDDQELIKTKIAERLGQVGAAPGKKSSKKAQKQTAAVAAVKDFCVEYAKSNRAMCRGCEIKIAKGEVRISKKDFESDDAKKYGGKDLWHHVDCFSEQRGALEYFESGDMLPGFNSLTEDDQEIVKKALPKEKSKVKDELDGAPEIKKVKKEELPDKELIKQNKQLFKYRDILKNMPKKTLQQLLEFNGQDQEITGIDARADYLADIMTFGVIEKCKVCKEGWYLYKSSVGYECQGNLTEWTKCLKVEKAPKRIPFKLPNDVKEDFPELKKYKCVVGERKILIRDLPQSSSKPAGDELDSGPKVQRFAPLRNLSFFIIGKLKQNKDDLKRQIVKLGGTLSSSFNVENLTAIISNEAAVDNCNDKMESAKNAGIHVVPESFFEECLKGGDISKLITEMSIAPWGTNLQSRILVANLNSAAKSKSKSIYSKSGPSKVTVQVKDGLAVDPDANLENVSVYVDKDKTPYTVVLSKTDIQKGLNSFYKMQLLVDNNSSVMNKKYYLFRSWGRIGTSIGNDKTDKYRSLDEAIKQFHIHFNEKTNNSFKDKDNFVKKSNCYYPVDISYGGNEDDVQLSMKSEFASNLHDSVQKLVSLMFDVELMKKVMMEFELDLEKMPLGKLSKKQMMKAFEVLSELQKSDGDIKPAMVIDCTNRFYTLIPHSFGKENPPKLDNKEIIQSKTEMLESLLEMETAYSMLKETGGGGDDEIHPIDKHYSKLNTTIEVVEKESDDYILIDKYVKNTHAETHRSYELEIIDLFKIKRQGEDKRFKPFKKLHNRKLLWHGSRLTNFAGILSQGLRIAPPEAPVTGYMFGKGIYFADMVSKSANYCVTSRNNNTGLLLLCEVALGDMYERTHAEFVEKLPKGKHSTKGIGVTTPDPKGSVDLESGLEVPAGKGIKVMDYGKTSLLYNEYIVYDPAQVRARYLVKAKFNYKY